MLLYTALPMSLYYEVVPNEPMQQVREQNYSCPGDTTIFTCSFSGNTVVTWLIGEEIIYRFLPSDVGTQDATRTTRVNLIGRLLTDALTTLSILPQYLENGSIVVACEQGGSKIDTAIVIFG